MKANDEEFRTETIRPLVDTFFPDKKLHDNELLAKQIDTGQILVQPNQLLPYLQTAFFEEHLLELQLDQSTRRYFSNILDNEPENEENDQDGEYETGSYLKATDNFFITPLTPAIGNANIRSSKYIIVRFFMGTSAIELGCTFRGQNMLGGTPMLSLDFPAIGRINRNYRPFRVKAVSGINAQLTILTPESSSETIFRLEDISTMGLAFQVPNDKQNFKIGETVRFKVKVAGINDLEIGGLIRHISKVRDTKGYRNVCGVQFDLETRALAAKIEQLTAAIQRLQLREIAEKVSDLRGVRIIK